MNERIEFWIKWKNKTEFDQIKMLGNLPFIHDFKVYKDPKLQYGLKSIVNSYFVDLYNHAKQDGINEERERIIEFLEKVEPSIPDGSLLEVFPNESNKIIKGANNFKKALIKKLKDDAKNE